MEGTPDRISRRRMLKRIGAGAAVAWSAPVLSSLRTPAFAQQLYPECADCPEICPQGVCGRVDQGCSCLLTVRRDCFCHDIVFCDIVTPCTTDADCTQAGWRCAFSCCDPTGAQAFCHPPCGAGLAPQQAGGAGGRTSAG